ncbi:hypothetical protein ABZ946_33445 [Streptomyces sp. NPDC046324]|uniref:hypothetical protein n=1 Tax=Streptomyces sp. NPDC046324 TaxID=3154915 RepID=UPI0033F40630
MLSASLEAFKGKQGGFGPSQRLLNPGGGTDARVGCQAAALAPDGHDEARWLARNIEAEC